LGIDDFQDAGGFVIASHTIQDLLDSIHSGEFIGDGIYRYPARCIFLGTEHGAGEHTGKNNTNSKICSHTGYFIKINNK
jgi:hypothetical protein